MKIEILYFDECPSYLTAEETLRGVLAEQAIEARVELVAVNMRPTTSSSQTTRPPDSSTDRKSVV